MVMLQVHLIMVMVMMKMVAMMIAAMPVKIAVNVFLTCMRSAPPTRVLKAATVQFVVTDNGGNHACKDDGSDDDDGYDDDCGKPCQLSARCCRLLQHL